MKQLTLIRHGKSDHSLGLADIERLLNNRGESDALLMGALLKQQQAHFDRMFSSPAERASKTAQLINSELGDNADVIIIDPMLYTFDSDELYRFIECLDDDLEQVAIVGHNPGITLLVNDLCNSSSIDNMPTCSIAKIELDITEWVDVSPGSGELKQFDRPKQYR